MLGPKSRVPAAIALLGAVLGLIFATYSTLDYAAHLDRRLHDVHCSVIPGAPATSEAEGCRTAMYSSYSAVLREQYWGGLPISLFALGAFTFFVGFAVYLLVAAHRAPAKAVVFHAAASVTPLLASIVMFTISVTRLGTLCQTCVGIYAASFLLALGGLLGLLTLRRTPELHPPGIQAAPVAAPTTRPSISMLLPVAWVVALAFTTLMPAIVYAASAPDHTKYLGTCGEIKQAPREQDGMIKIRTSRSVQPALFFEDPLCPTCKAFHDRLLTEGIFEKLDVQLVLFPLDNACNWMLDNPLHPGACAVSKAVLCGNERALQVLEWAFEEQEYLARAGKAGEPILRAVIQEKWGADMIKCMDDRQTSLRLNRHLHFAAENGIPISTPQVYLGKRRVCDEDTDIGLRYTFAELAPEVVR
jgi:hypothetical protein